MKRAININQKNEKGFYYLNVQWEKKIPHEIRITIQHFNQET